MEKKFKNENYLISVYLFFIIASTKKNNKNSIIRTIKYSPNKYHLLQKQ